MINNSVIRNCTTPAPIIQSMINEHALGKIELKNIYQKWSGENIEQIKERHNDNPYMLRIGMPSTDNQMAKDPIYFILHYLSYNPLTKDVEMRHIIPHRNTEKLYIGQSIDEKHYTDYRLFVDGTAIVGDLYLKNSQSLRDVPLSRTIANLVAKVEKLQQEIIDLKRQVAFKDTYKQEHFSK
jgi:hypothetical protein